MVGSFQILINFFNIAFTFIKYMLILRNIIVIILYDILNENKHLKLFKKRTKASIILKNPNSF